MKIGFFTSVEGWGGSEPHIKDLMLQARKMGFEVILFGVAGTRLFSEMQTEGIKCIAWNDLKLNKPNEYRRTEKSGNIKRFILKVVPAWVKILMGEVRMTWRLKRLFAENRVDLMNVTICGYELAGIACWLNRISSVGMYESFPDYDSPYYRWWPKKFLIKYTAGFYDGIFGTSRSTVEAWIPETGIKREKFFLIWNGVDVTRFTPRDMEKPRLQEDPFHIISAGRLHPMKGFRYCIEAINILNDKRATLNIYGEGPEEDELKKLMGKLELGDRMVLQGQIEDIESELKKADCFVLASTMQESCPFALLEAMASGLPVITSDFGALPEINIHGVTGLVVPARDSKRLAEAISNLINNPELCIKMGRAGRDRVVAQFSRERMIKDTFTLYDKILQENQHKKREC